MKKIRVCVAGAAGTMGQEVIRTVDQVSGMEVAGAIDVTEIDRDAGLVAGTASLGVKISGTAADGLKDDACDVVVDFTHAEALRNNLPEYLDRKVALVIGTTGLAPSEIDQLEEAVKAAKTGCLYAPNFAIGAVLMMQFSRIASRYMERSEIIEFHHPQKKDAPSGTAIKTAEAIRKERDFEYEDRSSETVKGARGGTIGPINVHSIRLPGFVAHQEVLFGGTGQVLTIRHDSFNRTSFMPGVVMAIRHVNTHSGFFYGLETILDL